MTYCFKKKSRYVYPLPLAVVMLFAYSQALYAATGNGYGSSKNEVNWLQQKNIKVTGVVTDSKGAPIKGVSVMQKGLNSGTMTDAEGRYSIAVPDGQTVLVFSAIGYLEKQENVNDRDKIDITLFESISDLDDVVVIGYGTQKKRDVTGAITSISAKQIEERQAVNIADALQGQAAGLLVVNNSGEPGAESSVTIRGGSTFSSAGNEPLYVIDGVVGANGNNINPNDIQSIEILKDAASSAIYGSRAANGVIIITTKKGQEGKPKIDVRYLRNYGFLAHKLRQANASEVRLFRQKQSPNSSGAGSSTDSLNPGFNADNDYQDALTRVAKRDQVDLGLSGGSKTLNYYTNMRYVNDQGLILNSWGKQVQARTNLDFVPNEKFKFITRYQFGYRKRNNINEGNTINQTFQRPTNFTLYYPDGSLTGYVSGRRNPLSVALYEVNNEEQFNAQLFNEIQYAILKNLRFTTNYTFIYTQGYDLDFSPKILSSNTPLSNNGGEGFDRSTQWQYQAFINYDPRFGKNHSINLTAGFSAEKSDNKSTYTEARNYATEAIIAINSAQTILPAEFNASGNTLASFFGRLGYSFKGKYTINGSVRYDGSSRFGKDNSWGLFPTIGAGWRISDEQFMQWAKPLLSDARFRASYGKVGNERIGNYDALQRYGFGRYYNTISGVAFGNSFGNPKLAWESLIQANFGLDISLLKNRISIAIDVYDKTTKDLLYNRPLPRETGFNSVRVNLGSIQTKGFEFQVNATAISTKNLNWNVVANYSRYKSIVKTLYNGESFISGNTADGGNAGWFIREGGQLGDFFGWKALGVYAYDESNAYNENWDRLTPNFDAAGKFSGYSYNGQPYTGIVQSLYGRGSKLRGGDVIFENLNRDSVIDDRDRLILGNAQPKFFAAIINTLTYKQFSLSFTFNTTWGNKIYNNAAQTLDNYGPTHIIPRPQTIYAAWFKPGDITNVPEVSRRQTTGNMRMNDRFLEDGSFIRLSYARLTYNLKPQWAKTIFSRGASLYVYGSNLVTWTNYTWFDPEFPSGDPLQMGQDNGRYPRRREVGVGVNVNF